SHGRAFKVLKRDELVRDVIPGHFQCAKYESFTRQLTAWDFRRCKRGPVPPLPSTQDQESSVLQRREYHEQSSQMDENDDVSHGGDDLDLAGYREDNDIRPTQMPPPQHGSDKSNYQAIEEHYQHDHQVPVHCPPVGHSDLGAPPSDAHAWGDAGSSDHYDAHYHYGTQGSHCNNPHYHVAMVTMRGKGKGINTSMALMAITMTIHIIIHVCRNCPICRTSTILLHTIIHHQTTQHTTVIGKVPIMPTQSLITAIKLPQHKGRLHMRKPMRRRDRGEKLQSESWKMETTAKAFCAAE
ncbi:hypothetical protein THAOC_09156, partial [Thalassiosira oceanica]